MINLKKTRPATIYYFEDVENQVYYEVTCCDGIVEGVTKLEWRYYEAGDAESGPKLGCDLENVGELEMSRVWFESDLKENPALIFKDAEEYTLYCMMNADENLHERF